MMFHGVNEEVIRKHVRAHDAECPNGGNGKHTEMDCACGGARFLMCGCGATLFVINMKARYGVGEQCEHMTAALADMAFYPEMLPEVPEFGADDGGHRKRAL